MMMRKTFLVLVGAANFSCVGVAAGTPQADAASSGAIISVTSCLDVRRRDTAHTGATFSTSDT